MTVHETRCRAAQTWSYVPQLLFHIPEAIWLIVFAAHTGICREEHAEKYLDYIMRTVLDRKTNWRAQLMEQLLGWLGSDGCALWMRPGGSVRLSIWDAEVPPGSMHKVALLCSKVTIRHPSFEPGWEHGRHCCSWQLRRRGEYLGIVGDWEPFAHNASEVPRARC